MSPASVPHRYNTLILGAGYAGSIMAERSTPAPPRRHASSLPARDGVGEQMPDVTFVGRLARYQYVNMDQVVGQALVAAGKLLEQLEQTEAALPKPHQAH